MNARLLLDLAEVIDNPGAFAVALRSNGFTTVDQLLDSVCAGADRTTRRTARSLLGLLRVTDDEGRLRPDAAAALAGVIELVLDVRSEIAARQPPPASRLVVTATTSPELARLRTALELRPLFQLVEDVIRAANETCVLGAPFWNVAALDRLRPSLTGFARRGGRVEFICQGGDPTDGYNPVGSLRRFCADLVADGAEAGVWAFDVRDESGRHALIHAKFALADRRFGYLGSANMTGQGFAEHFEIGVRLSEAEAVDLASLIERLRDGGFLARQ